MLTEIVTAFAPSALSKSTSTVPDTVSRSKKSGSWFSRDRLCTFNHSQARDLESSSLTVCSVSWVRDRGEYVGSSGSAWDAVDEGGKSTEIDVLESSIIEGLAGA